MKAPRAGGTGMWAAAAALLLGGAAAAQETAPAATAGTVQIQLNKLEPQEAACRAYLLLENPTDISFQTLTLDLVLFDTQGEIARRMAVTAAPLQAAKTSVKVFDIKELGCDKVGTLLLNDVIDCADATGPRQDCVALLVPSSRLGAKFIK